MNRKNLERTLDTAVEHHRAGRLDEAAVQYAKACAAAPRLFDAWYLAGALAVNRDRPAEAVPLLLRALQLQPGAAQCRLFLGMALFDTGRHAEAEKHLRAGLQKHPNYPDAWENLAAVLETLGQRAEAAECLQRVLDQRPDRTDIPDRIAMLSDAAAPFA